MRLIRVLLPVALLVGLATNQAPAYASIYQCGAGPTSQWIGYQDLFSATSGSTGARATMTTLRGSVCDTNRTESNFSTAWTLLRAESRTVGQIGYAQAGYMRYYNSPIYFFTEYQSGRGGSFVRQYFAGPIAGELHTFSTLVSGSAGNPIDMTVDATLLTRTPFPYYQLNNYADGNDCWGNCDLIPQWMSETTYQESDVPGTTSNKMRFSQMKHGQFGSGWYNAPNDLDPLNTNGRRWNFTGVSYGSAYGKSFDSWTFG